VESLVRESFSNYYVIAEPTLPFALEEQSPNSFRRRSEWNEWTSLVCFDLLLPLKQRKVRQGMLLRKYLLVDGMLLFFL
jgi:hypothetical protein